MFVKRKAEFQGDSSLSNESPRVGKRNPVPVYSIHHFGMCESNCFVQGKSGTHMGHPQGMPKEGNLFARFFSRLALPFLRFQASRIRGKGPDSTEILRDTPGFALCFNAFVLTSSDPFLCRPPWELSRSVVRGGRSEVQASNVDHQGGRNPVHEPIPNQPNYRFDCLSRQSRKQSLGEVPLWSRGESITAGPVYCVQHRWHAQLVCTTGSEDQDRPD